MSRKKKLIIPPITDEELKDIEYVMYCRRSSDESSEKQVASIPRQIDACLRYAKANNIKIKEKPKNFAFENEKEIDIEDNESDLEDRRILLSTRNLFIVKEKESAKTPCKRKKWTLLMEMLASGKIRGILSYSPDRQARNVMEGGELINYVDQGIVDLKYTNFHFEPTASGKMMLGIWFVFSKQYSDKLSEDVTSGNRRKFEKGETIGDIKHGYIRDEQNKWRPDGENWNILKEAFRLHLEEGWSDRVLEEWLEIQGYYHLIKNTGRKQTLKKSSINNLWTDPFYYGVWIRAGKVSYLEEIDPDFVPMITFAEHEMLCERHKQQKSKSNINTDDKYESIRMIENDFVVFEDKEGTHFNLSLNVPNYNNRHKKKLQELHKTNPKATLADILKPHQVKLTCNQHKVNLTLQDVDKMILKEIKKLNITEEHYYAYLAYAKDRLRIEFDEINNERAKSQLRINNRNAAKQDYIEKYMGADFSKEEKTIYDKRLKEFDRDIAFYENEIKELNKREKSFVFGVEIMLKFMKNAVDYYQRANYVQKGKIIKILFLNIVVNNKKQLFLAVNPAMQELFVRNGGSAGTRTQDQ